MGVNFICSFLIGAKDQLSQDERHGKEYNELGKPYKSVSVDVLLA